MQINIWCINSSLCGACVIAEGACPPSRRGVWRRRVCCLSTVVNSYVGWEDVEAIKLKRAVRNEQPVFYVLILLLYTLPSTYIFSRVGLGLPPSGSRVMANACGVFTSFIFWKALSLVTTPKSTGLPSTMAHS